MGKLGFMFSQDKNSQKNLYYNFKLYEKDNFVIFVDCNYFDGERVISFDTKFSYETSEFFYLNRNNVLEDHLVFDTKKFIKSKIALAETKSLDLNMGMCWVDVKLYHKLRQLLYINDGDLYDEVLKRIPFLLDIFNEKSFK